MTTVVVADDQELIRDGVAAILDAQPNFQVVGTAADVAEAIGLIQVAKPDVALMDIRMPVIDGIEATRRLTAAGVSTRILILTTYAADEFVVGALRAGASGFLLKEAPPRIPCGCRHCGSSGWSSTRRIGHPTPRVGLPRPYPTTDRVPGLDRLTPRESEVLALVGKGLNNAELARTLVVSESTIKTHLARILSKLEARDRIQLVVLANVAGLV